MAQNVNIQDLVNEAIKALTPTLAAAFATALSQSLTPATPAKDDDGKSNDEPRKASHKYAHKKIDSTFETTENEINYCEYSDKSYAIYGDTKSRKDIIKKFGENGRQKASWVAPLSAISGTPCGWCINKDALKEHGGIDALVSALAETGANVVERDSVKDVFDANKAKRDAQKAAKKDEPKADAPAPTAPANGGKKAKPSIAPTDEQKSGAKKGAPARKAPSKKDTVTATCYDTSKDSEDGYVKIERQLAKRDNWYYVQGSKGAIIYAHIGTDIETKAEVYAQIAKVKGDITKSIMPEFKTWNDIARDTYKAVTEGTCKATNAIMYAYYDCAAEQEVLDNIFAKIA